MFTCDDYFVILCNGFIVRYAFDDVKSFVTEEVIVYSLLLVEGYVGRCVVGFRCGCRVDMDFNGWVFYVW